MPELDLNQAKLEELANAAIQQGLTVPGVQKKLSLHLSTGVDSRLTIVDYPAGYILKPQAEEYALMPEYENLAMQMAALEMGRVRAMPIRAETRIPIRNGCISVAVFTMAPKAFIKPATPGPTN